MFSHLRSQDKKAPKFSHLINITHCTFNTSPHKKISRLRSNKFDDRTIFFTHLLHFLYQNLKQFPQVSICSVSKIQHSNGAVSSYRLISKIISSVSRSRMMQPHGVGVLYFSHDAETAVSRSPLLGLRHNEQKIVFGDQMPILAVL
jgi:hypothetical protein